MSYIIRPMEQKDIEQVVMIENSVFSMPWSAHSFIDASKTESNIYLVCVENDEVAGYCGLWTMIGEGNITNLAISEKHRGKGYGSALMEDLEKRGILKDVNKFFLEVRKSNDIAQNLYLRLRYKIIGVRKNFYDRPVEDAIIMSKSI